MPLLLRTKYLNYIYRHKSFDISELYVFHPHKILLLHSMASYYETLARIKN
jgi:hypothetical protein